MSKVKMFAAIPRKPGISAQEFHDHWRHPHGTMGRRISLLRKYVQGHQIDCDLLGPDQTRFEGIAEAWMDSAADAAVFPEEPIYKNEVVPDEPLFIDLDNLKFLITTEEVLMSAPDPLGLHDTGDGLWFDDDRSVNIKIVQLVEEESDIPWAGDRDRALGCALGAFRHVRSRPVPEIHGAEPPFLGVRELWWPTLSSFRKGTAAAPDVWDELIGRPAKAFTALVQAERFK